MVGSPRRGQAYPLIHCRDKRVWDHLFVVRHGGVGANGVQRHGRRHWWKEEHLPHVLPLRLPGVSVVIEVEDRHAVSTCEVLPLVW
jgi:hypothetical protein